MHEFDGRTVINLPGGTDGLRGPARTIAITAEARTLADAIVARLDRIDMFEDEGRLKMLINGGWQIVTSEVLRGIIRANCARKHLIAGPTGLAVELRPVEPGELVVRTMLTAPPNEGGLLGRVPGAVLEQGRQVMEEVAAAAAVVLSPETEVEIAAGQRTSARYGGVEGERTRQEIKRGEQRLAELQN
jgi:hypothetical protein